MSDQQEGRARTPRSSARPCRPHAVHGQCILVDVLLALIVIVTALSIVTAPTTGPIDGRHLLAVAALTPLLIRTTRATRR